MNHGYEYWTVAFFVFIKNRLIFFSRQFQNQNHWWVLGVVDGPVIIARVDWVIHSEVHYIMTMNESFRCSGLWGNFVSHSFIHYTKSMCLWTLVQGSERVTSVSHLFWKLNFLISVSHESFGDKGVCDGSTPVVPVKITLLSLVLFCFCFL